MPNLSGVVSVLTSGTGRSAMRCLQQPDALFLRCIVMHQTVGD